MKQRKRFWTVWLLFLLCVTAASAQSDAMLNHYFMATSYYNPAAVGKTNELNLTGLYRMQWLGMENAPKQIFATADMPFKFKKIQSGVGIMFYSEKAGMYSDVSAALQYAYKRKLGKGTLSIGLRGGLYSRSFNGDSIHIPNSEDHSTEDEAIPTGGTASGKNLDIALGLFYSTDKYYVGLASTHILAPNIELDENVVQQVDREYNLTAGYNIKLKNPLIVLQLSIFVQTDIKTFAVGDVTARAVYKNMFNGGLGARFGDNGGLNSMILYLGANIWKFRVSYSYEYPFTAISKVSSGSHEAMVTYQLQLKKPKGGKNKHKSIRIL